MSPGLYEAAGGLRDDERHSGQPTETPGNSRLVTTRKRTAEVAVKKAQKQAKRAARGVGIPQIQRLNQIRSSHCEFVTRPSV